MLKMIEKGWELAKQGYQKAVGFCKKVIVKTATVVAVAAVGTAPAMAADATATIDSAPIVATITSGITVVSAIGVAVLSLVVTIKLFKWVQRVL